jgi:multiple sugar transport system substrate-binding protein
LRIALAALLALVLSTSALAQRLVINANTSDPAPRAAWQAAVDRFAAENPNLQVEFNVFDHESYKRSIRNWLTSASPDVVFWFAGNRMRQFVTPNLLLDVSDLYDADTRAQFAPQTLDLVSVDGRQYGVPYAFYQVGFYFRRDLLERAGAKEPSNWEELIALCEKLKVTGVDAFALGTKEPWPAAAWFDYINLRLNGRDFHLALTGGMVEFTDARVRAVFDRWRELVDRSCFARNHATMTWQEAQALIYRGRAAMMLIGNYIVPHFPPEMRGQMDFFAFPVIRRDIGSFEEAPMNSLHIPARAANKEAARMFLAYVARPETQSLIARGLVQVPANRHAQIPDDPFLKIGRELIASADGLTQYFDRDANEEFAVVAMKGFQEFLLRPERLGEILDTIEKVRRRIHPN